MESSETSATALCSSTGGGSVCCCDEESGFKFTVLLFFVKLTVMVFASQLRFMLTRAVSVLVFEKWFVLPKVMRDGCGCFSCFVHRFFKHLKENFSGD